MNKAQIITRLDQITGSFTVDFIQEGFALSREKWKLIAMAPSLLNDYRRKLCGVCNTSIGCNACPMNPNDGCSCTTRIPFHYSADTIKQTRAAIKSFRIYLDKTLSDYEAKL